MRIFVFVLLLLPMEKSFSQTHPTIRTGRPGKSIGPFVLGGNWVQIQSGLEHKRRTGVREGEDNLLGNVVRFGLSESWEINGRLNYSDTSQRLPTYNPRNSRLSALNLGFRYNFLNDSKGNLKGLGFQTNFKLANNKGELDSLFARPILTLASLLQLTPSVRLISNVGISFEEIQPSPTYFATLNFAHNFNDRWGGFFELFGNSAGPISRVYLDSGVFFFLSPDLQLDAALGWGYNQSQSEVFVDIGVSWRFRVD